MDTKNIKLIDGTFKPDEAKKILTGVLTSKINYHMLDAFSNQIRFDGDVVKSKLRVEELKTANEQVIEIIAFAHNNNLKIKVESHILITLVH